MMKDRRIFIICLFLFWAVRIWAVASDIEDITNNDELDSGLLFAQLSGPRIVGFSSSFFQRVGGSLVYQAAVVPFYSVFGQGLITLKLMAVFLGSLFLWVLFRTVYIHAGRNAAFISALFFSLPVPGYLRMSLIPLADYFIIFIFVLLSADMLLRIAASGDEKVRVRGILLGLILGSAVSFNYVSLLALLACALLAVSGGILNGRRRVSLWVLSGFLIGILPILFLSVKNGVQNTFFVYHRNPWSYFSFDPRYWVPRMVDFFVSDFPGSFRLEGISGGGLLRDVWYLMVVVLVAGELLRRRNAIGSFFKGLVSLGRVPFSAADRGAGLEIFMFIFTACFIAVYSFSSFKLEKWHVYGYRYFAYIMPAVIIIVSCALARIRERSSGLFLFLTVVIVLIPFVASFSPGAADHPGRILAYQGISYQGLADKILPFEKNPADMTISRMTEKMDDFQKGEFIMSLGKAALRYYSLRGALEAVRERIDRSDRNHFYRGLNLYLSHEVPRELSVSDALYLNESFFGFEAVLLDRMLMDSAVFLGWEGQGEIVTFMTAARRRSGFLLEVMGAFMVRDDGTVDPARLMEITPDLSAGRSDEQSIWKGAGLKLGYLRGYPYAVSKDVIEMVPYGECRRSFIEGAAQSLRYLDGIKLYPWEFVSGSLSGMDMEKRSAALKNIGMGTLSYPDRYAYTLASEIKRHLLDPADRKSFCRGIGKGVILNFKGINNCLRWFIDWDKYAGQGCGKTFWAGVCDGISGYYGDDNGFAGVLKEKLRRYRDYESSSD